MTAPQELNYLLGREERARKQAERSASKTARLAHLARAEGYAEKIEAIRAEELRQSLSSTMLDVSSRETSLIRGDGPSSSM